MNWVSFISSGMAVLFIYALFAEQEEENELELDLYQCIKCKRHVDLRKI
ncbi:hypothetical protein [Bacillus sp. TE8-1]|nr:hypothetical protein [Bacillus sp. TE8-1]